MDTKRTEPTQAAASAAAATDKKPSPAASAAAVKDVQTVAEDSFLSPGRRLSTSCTFDPSKVVDFEEAVMDGDCDMIELESGVYTISATLVIERNLTIQAKTPAPTGNAVSSVVLVGGDDNQFRVVKIDTSGGTVSLIGLGITNGRPSGEVCVPPPRATCQPKAAHTHSASLNLLRASTIPLAGRWPLYLRVQHGGHADQLQHLLEHGEQLREHTPP